MARPPGLLAELRLHASETPHVSLKAPEGVDWTGGSVRVELPRGTPEITLRNNAVGL